MSDNLILSFPVLKDGGGDFLEEVSYTVEATQGSDKRKLFIDHALTGDSFIAELIKNKRAKFSVSLFYKDSAERQKIICDDFDFDDETKEITAEQKIDIDFSYAPEITANIVLLNDETITVNSQSGLTDFWQDEKFEIPAFSRIAHHLKLKFSSGDVSSLMWKSMDESYSDGSIKTIVTETVRDGDQPIKITCAKDVYDELNNGFTGNMGARMAARNSIVTQILCHVYAYMNNLKDKEMDIHSGLLQHMEMVKDETMEDWESDDFNASLAATKMFPYAIKEFNNEDR